MKVSIITITYNSESTLSETISSVLSQTYHNIEYIIVDGASTDGTISIIQSYRDKITTFISEKDNGLYYALNKGLQLATGDVIGILHSDDFYTNTDVIKNIVEKFTSQQCDAVYANLYYVDKNNTNKIHRKWEAGDYKHGMFLNGWMPPHPTVFVKREVYQKYGVFNTSLTSAADYELMLRFIHKNRIKITYLPQYIIKMRIGGKSNVTLKNRLKANTEDRIAWKLNNITPRFYTLYFKPLRKIVQLFKR